MCYHCITSFDNSSDEDDANISEGDEVGVDADDDIALTPCVANIQIHRTAGSLHFTYYLAVGNLPNTEQVPFIYLLTYLTVHWTLLLSNILGTL